MNASLFQYLNGRGESPALTTNKTLVSVHVSGSDCVSISDTEGPLAVTHLNFKQRGKQFNISIVQISISNIEI